MELSKKAIVSRITNDNNTEYIISIPNKWFIESEGLEYRILRVGQFRKKIKCFSNDTENTVEISNKLLTEIGLYYGETVNIIIDLEEIRIGPVIAVFVNNGNINRGKRQKPNFRSKSLNQANKLSSTILYFFSIKDVDFVNKKIRGLCYDDKLKQWKQKKFPFPDVLYDRGGGILKKQKLLSQYIREQLEKGGNIKKFNPKFFLEKWDLYDNVSKYDSIKEYLPDTVKYTGLKQLKSFIDKNNRIFIKDIKGNNGKNIIMIEKVEENKYKYAYMKGKLKTGKINGINSLNDFIKKNYGSKEVVIQKAIDVMKIGDRNLDMRVLVQRDRYGEIIITDFLVRMGVEGSPVTNTKTGSAVFKMEKFFSEYFNCTEDQIKDLNERITIFIVKIHHVIEDAFGEFGEIGIDFALDKNNKLWFIEANAKPGKDTIFKACDSETITKVFLNPLEYCKYISDF